LELIIPKLDDASILTHLPLASALLSILYGIMDNDSNCYLNTGKREETIDSEEIYAVFPVRLQDTSYLHE
jgi:hypothetical protein